METETPDRIVPLPSTKLAGGQLVVAGGTVLPETMKEVETLAQYMAKAGSAIPHAMQGNPGECMAVIMDAVAWRMNPWAVARMRYITKSKDGHLTGGYMGQLFMSVLNTRAPLKRRMIPEYVGEHDALICKLRGETLDGQVLEYETPKLKDISPQNSPLWKSDPRQQIAYYAFRAFGRRFFPEIFMGVYDPEEVHEIARMRDITPEEPVKNMLDDPDDAPAHIHQGEVIAPERKPAGVGTVQRDEHVAEIEAAFGPGDPADRARELFEKDQPRDSTAEESAAQAEMDVAPPPVDLIFENIVKSLRASQTSKDYAAWRAESYTPKTRKQIGEQRWALLGKVMAEVEDRVGYL